jgi:glycosidase
MNARRFNPLVATLIVIAAVAGLAGVADAAPVAVTFSHMPPGNPTSVYLAGEFNSWNPGSDQMTDDDGDGVFTVTLQLAPGTYAYKFVVDDRWQEDPFSDTFADDGYGGKNSVLVVPDGVNKLITGVARGKPDKAPASAKEAVEPAPGDAPAGSVPVTFVFDAGTSANVYVAGEFNSWNASADKMVDEDGDGVYELTLHLAPGRYMYKFVRDGSWLTDETAAEFADDGFGGQNSVLTVPEGSEGMRVGEGAAAPAGGNGGDGGQASGDGEQMLKQVTFRFQPVISGVTNVFLAGTFNDWNDSRTRMTDEDGDGTYEATLLLPVGEYQYKFVADGSWITDETATDFVDDGFGGRNSVIRVDASYEDVEIELGDGKMMSSDLSFVMDYSMVNPTGENSIEFRTRTHRGDVEKVRMLYRVDGGEEQAVDMEPEESDAAYQYYGVTLNEPVDSRIRFTFEYNDRSAAFYASPSGVADVKPAAQSMFEYSSDVIEPFFTPDWAKDGVFYQIFPERFYNGDKSNDPDFTEPYYAGANQLPPSGKTNGEYFHLVPQWENVTGLTHSPYRTDGKPDYYSFYGGDIAGVMEKIPYLADLGITIIYFNPLNQARSNHKYDPMDYLSIDPHFADEATFKEFTKKAHEAGIRIIVDMAFNHTGDWHFAFLDGKEKGRESKYWDWYEWKRWPLPDGPIENPLDYYDCWWGFGIHPNLNYDLSRPNAQENAVTDVADAVPNQELVEYILQVARYWLGDLDIDGFRLDVPNEVPFWFWREFRQVCDETKPGSFLIGELWGNAMPWLGPHCFHSTMNYKYFADPVLKFLGRGQGSAAQFDMELAPGRSLYPIQATQVMMNLIGSHDTERFLTRVGNKDDRLMLAALFQMTYVGIPQIYYGDEVGLKGGKDPDCRRTFPWSWEQSPRRKAIHDFYRKAIVTRHKYSALRTGRFRTLLTQGKAYAFLREDGGHRIVVALNAGDGAASLEVAAGDHGFADGTRFVDELSGTEFTVDGGTLSLPLGGVSGAILVAQ